MIIFHFSVFANMFHLEAIQSNSRKSKGTNTKQKNIVHVMQFPMYTAREFAALMDYMHRGVCDIGPSNVIGLFVAADEFNLMSLKRYCVNFLGQRLSSDNVIYILSELGRFQSRECAIELEPILYNYIRLNADKVLLEATVTMLSKSQLIRVFCLEGLQIAEINKFHAALVWAKAHLRRNRNDSASLQSVFSPFLNSIKLTKIPIQSLVDEVRRSRVVPERMLAHACTYNEFKESFQLTRQKVTATHSQRKVENLGAGIHQPFVVGMHSSASSDSNSHQSHGKSNRKLIKKGKNRYDVSQQTLDEIDSKISNPRLTKSKRTLSSAGIQITRPVLVAPKSDAPTLSSFKPKVMRTSKSSRLLISSTSDLTTSTPSRPKLTKSSKVSAPLLDIMF